MEVMGDYFSKMANDIGGQHVLKLTEQDFNNHQSVKAIRHTFYDSQFQFEKTNHSQVENELRKLNTSKAPGWDEISPKILGVCISQDLTWNIHIDYVVKKANKQIYAPRLFERPVTCRNNLICIYITPIRSIRLTGMVSSTGIP